MLEGKKCTACGIVTVKQTVIKATGHDETTIITKATTKKNGKEVTKCQNCDKTLSTKIIYSAKTLKLSYTTSTYSGKMKSPKIIVKDSKGKTISSKNYTITKPFGRKNVGKYTYKIKFKNQYSGTKTLYLTINPKAPVIKKPVALKKGITAKWSKVSKQATGYEIMIATNKKFTKGKRTVKVTSYKTVKGKKYYSTWSKVKTVKTKR